jgi:hypothetical protein
MARYAYYVMALLIDTGTVTIALQVIVLLLLLVGVSFAKGKERGRSLYKHGLATTLAFVMHMTAVFIVMIPSFYTNFLLVLVTYDIVSGSIVWLHVMTGIMAPILGFIIIVSWRFRPPPRMTCAKRRRLMMPTFLIWTVSLISGIFVQLGGII